jgi:hypothetical protein
VLAVGDDQLEPERLEVRWGIRALGEAIEDGEQRVGLPQLARNLRATRHVDDADRRRRDLLRADDLCQPIEAIVRDHGHAELGFCATSEYAVTCAPAWVSALKSVVFPELGRPTMPTRRAKPYPAKPTRPRAHGA